MATFQERDGKWRAIVRRQGFKAKSRTFPTKTAAKVWADRTERELAESEARGVGAYQAETLASLVDWYKDRIGKMKSISKTQSGNLTRVVEGLGSKVASRLTVDDIVEHARRRCQGEHLNHKGMRIPACKPATMTVEIGYLAEVLKLANSLSQIRVLSDVVAEARPTLRLLKLISKSAERDRRPTADELRKLREYFDGAAWRSSIPMSDVIDFAITSAKRESEITRLLWSDIDEQGRTALLRDAKHPRAKEGNHRRFALLGEAWGIVQRQPRINGEDRIFPFNHKSVGTAFARATRALAIKDLHFHDLRHEATSRLFEQGYAIPEVASVTLHRSWAQLKRYTQIRPESLHRLPDPPLRP